MAANNIFIFMAGDNNLDASANTDIQEMLQSKINTGLNVIIQYDRSKRILGLLQSEPTKRLKVENHQLTTIDKIGETNTGDPAVLYGFLEWGTHTYSANRNVVILWGHGDGIKEPDKDRDEKKLYGTDDTSGDYLDNSELNLALTIPGTKFAIIAFDACLMSMFEIIYQIKDLTEIVIGSEETEPPTGWPYQAILDYISANPMVDNAILAEKIVALYKGSYLGSDENVTQSAIRTDSFDIVAKSLDDFARVLTELLNIPGTRDKLLGVLYTVQRFRDRDFIDLFVFVWLCQANIERQSIKDSAAHLLELLKKAVIANITVGENVKEAYGISMYFPLDKPTPDDLQTYENLKFTQDFPNWFKLIKSYYRLG